MAKDINRDDVIPKLKSLGIPAMVYYQKPMHMQEAFEGTDSSVADAEVTTDLCNRVLSLPLHPYMTEEEEVLYYLLE